MNNMINKGIVIAGIAALASCSWLYPYKACKKGLNYAWECKVAENWSEDWNSNFVRYTEIGDKCNCIVDLNCSVDGECVDRAENGDYSNYTIMIDSDCDGGVNYHMDNAGLKARDSFGDKYDSDFNTLKDKVGDYSWQHEDWYETSGKSVKLKFRK